MPRKFINIRSHRCDLSKSKSADLVRQRAYWFAPVFKNGTRVPEQISEEWDFRFIKNLEEARQAAIYEYAREVEWMYDYQAERCATLCVNSQRDNGSKILKRFQRRWDPHNIGGEAFVGLTADWMESVFPIPLAKVPRAHWGEWKRKTRDGVISLSQQEYQDRIRWEGRFRAHALQVDWSLSDTAIEQALRRWTRATRPSEVAVRVAPRGRRIMQPFQQLKWLTASRLAASGLSYKRARLMLPQRTLDGRPVDINDPNDVLPLFASQGAWTTAVIKARSLPHRLFFDPS